MKTSVLALAAVIGLVAGLTAVELASPDSPALAQHALPGMCNGRTDPNVHINATANGPGAHKYILNIWTDAAGTPRGRMILGQGADRITVDDWCRVWQHLPGQAYGACGADIPEGAVTAHAVGIATYGSQQLLVRTDLRETHEGMFFRVRYRTIGQHGGDHDAEESGHEDGEEGCEDETWTRIPSGEGWAVLNSLTVR